MTDDDYCIHDFTLHCVEMEIKKLIVNNREYQKQPEYKQDTTMYLIFENRILVLYELLGNIRGLKVARKDYLKMIKEL